MTRINLGTNIPEIESMVRITPLDENSVKSNSLLTRQNSTLIHALVRFVALPAHRKLQGIFTDFASTSKGVVTRADSSK